MSFRSCLVLFLLYFPVRMRAQSAAEPYVIEDGGYSLEPFYWLNRQQPSLHSGAAATAPGDLAFGGLSKFSYGGVASVPAGPQNTLRFTYFRVQGNSNTCWGRE